MKYLLMLTLLSIGVFILNKKYMPEAKKETKPQPKQVETDPIKIAIPLVVLNEGYKEKAYYDKMGKVWTIGTGITRYADGTPVKQGDVITKEKNDKELYNYLQKGHEALKKLPAYKDMNPNQIASALDLSFNIGYNWNKTRNASLLDATSSKEKLVNFPDAMRKYTKAGGKTVQGLVNRRERAVELFNTPYTPPPPPPPPQPVSSVPMGLMIKGDNGLPTFDVRPTPA
jgi:lysozyme